MYAALRVASHIDYRFVLVTSCTTTERVCVCVGMSSCTCLVVGVEADRIQHDLRRLDAKQRRILGRDPLRRSEHLL